MAYRERVETFDVLDSRGDVDGSRRKTRLISDTSNAPRSARPRPLPMRATENPVDQMAEIWEL